MFARVITAKGKQYLNIIENYREGKKVKQKVVANLGRVDELKVSSIETLAQKLLSIVNSPKAVNESSTPDIPIFITFPKFKKHKALK